MNKLSIETCVGALSESLGFGKRALNTELAISLALFTGAGAATQEVRGAVMGVYLKAGYDCETSSGKHYKTVNRRIGAAAGLYTKLGQEKVLEWIAGTSERKMLAAIITGIEPMGFQVMDDVLEYVGKTSNRGRPRKDPDLIVPTHRFTVGKMHIELPIAMGPVELIKLASKILAYARKMENEHVVELRQSGVANNPGNVVPLH